MGRPEYFPLIKFKTYVLYSMLKKCRICPLEVKVKGFCLNHYIQYTKKEIDIKGVPISLKTVTEPPTIRLPSNWNLTGTASKLAFISSSYNIPLLTHIALSDPDDYIKYHCDERIVQLGSIPPKNKDYCCKISGCKGGPNAKGHFSKGFCHRHYMQHTNGIIDVEGKTIRPVVDRKNIKYVKCKVYRCVKKSFKKCFCEKHFIEFSKGLRNIHGEKLSNFLSNKGVEKPLNRFNKMVRALVFIRGELKELRNSLFLDKNVKKGFLKQLGFLDDNLKFILNPSFILSSMSLLENMTLKALLGGEREEPVNVDIELTNKKDTRRFKGMLIKGQNANMAITKYEIINEENKDVETVFFLKDKVTSSFPFECKASDIEGNLVHQIKITESE